LVFGTVGVCQAEASGDSLEKVPEQPMLEESRRRSDLATLGLKMTCTDLVATIAISLGAAFVAGSSPSWNRRHGSSARG
jgi:hypothetical protein